MRSLYLLLFPLFALLLLSCGSTQKVPNYIQDASSGAVDNVPVPELLIQKNDLLGIQVYSASTRPDISDALYNLPASSAGSSASGNSNTQGYLVDYYGNIEMPRIGPIHAEGLTKNQLADLIKRKINEKDSVLTRPSVIVRFLNLKVTVLGEVGQQGVVSIPGERITIMEALGLAGGMTPYAQKQNVKVIREVNGKREIGFVDVSSKNLFDSPYYNLLQNDLVVVDPHPRKAKVEDQNIAMQRVSFGLSIITALGLLYNLFRN